MRGEERRQRPMLMVLKVEQRIARDHPLRRIKQMAARVLNISADDADMFAVATFSSRWLREHWPEIIRDRAISVPFSSWDDGDAFAQYDLGVQPSPSVVQGAVLLSDGVDPPQGTQLRVVLTTVNDSSPDQSTFTSPDGSLHRACGWRHASGSKEPIDTCLVDVQPELGTRRAGILETTV